MLTSLSRSLRPEVHQREDPMQQQLYPGGVGDDGRLPSLPCDG